MHYTIVMSASGSYVKIGGVCSYTNMYGVLYVLLYSQYKVVVKESWGWIQITRCV